MEVPAEARHHLEKAFLELDAAHLIWGVWADDVRQQVEKRLGAVLGDDAGDDQVRDDPEYGAALDAGKPYSDALATAAHSLAAMDPECAQALRECRLQFLVRSRQGSR